MAEKLKVIDRTAEHGTAANRRTGDSTENLRDQLMHGSFRTTDESVKRMIMSMRIARVIVYLWALPTTLLGLILLVPTILTGGRARWVDGVLEIYGGFTSLFLRRATLLKGGASAMTLGHVVLGRDTLCLDATRAHERVHVRQCERWGPLFVPAYLLSSVVVVLRGGNAYLDNPFEREAYGREKGL